MFLRNLWNIGELHRVWFIVIIFCMRIFALSTSDNFDYVIVGGGATGLSLAVRLSEDPSKTVIVLEAGATPNITDLRLNRGNFGTPNDWQFVTVPQVDAGNRSQAQVQGRVLGGGSAINSGMYLRGNKMEYDALETLGATGWNWDSMFAAVKKSEHFFPPTESDVHALNLTYNPAFHGVDGPIAISIQAQNVSRFFGTYAIPTLQALGHDINFDPNGGRHNGASWDYLTALRDTSTRSYAVSGYYLPIANRSNLIVQTGSHVSKVLWAPRRANESDSLLTATGVEYLVLNDQGISTDTRTVSAKNVILSGGTLNTPKILEHSGVGDPSVLESLGIDVKIDLPGVGSNLCNQPLTTASFLLKNGTVDGKDSLFLTLCQSEVAVLITSEAGNAIRSAIIDVEPFSTYLTPADLERSQNMLSTLPHGLSSTQFKVMKNFILNTDIPQIEFAWTDTKTSSFTRI
ncbi:hypothetical protein H0H93_003835 [Arthromyces matolae]|nr:hypothetical protein H0H93_003835 [Arthromyces matolae]